MGPVLVTPLDDILPVDLSGHTQGLFNVTGLRVPMVVVSPWVKPPSVSHLPTEYTSMLKLIETRFDVPALTQRDATADDMTDPTNGSFDFSTPHLLQVPALPTQPMARATRHWRARRIRHSEGWSGWRLGRTSGYIIPETRARKRERPPRTAICGGRVCWTKIMRGVCLAGTLPLFLLGGFLRGFLLSCHWVIPPCVTFSLEG